MDENTIVVTDELGNEVEYEILFTFENEENGHQYVVYFDPEKMNQKHKRQSLMMKVDYFQLKLLKNGN